MSNSKDVMSFCISRENIKTKITNFEYILVFIFIILCGFTSADVIPAKTYILSILCGYYILQKKNKQSLKSLFVLVIGYILIGILQYFKFGYFSYSTIRDIPLLIFSGFYIVDKLGYKFRYAYFNIMVILSVISVVFFVLMVVANYIPDISVFSQGKPYKSIFVYCIRSSEILRLRNCGPFWEPGAFAGYVILVGVLYFKDLKVLWNTQRKKCLMLLLALLTTQSSQGYIMFIILLLGYIYKDRLTMRVIAVSMTMVVAAFIIYNETPFLREKVEEQLSLSKDWESNESLISANRFTTSLLDFYYIEKSPFIGNTDNQKIRYRDHDAILYVVENKGGYGTGSGTTWQMATYGIPLYLLWLFLSCNSLRKFYSKKETLMVITIIILLGSAELYNTYIFYMSLPFIIYGRCRSNMNKKESLSV